MADRRSSIKKFSLFYQCPTGGRQSKNTPYFLCSGQEQSRENSPYFDPILNKMTQDKS